MAAMRFIIFALRFPMGVNLAALSDAVAPIALLRLMIRNIKRSIKAGLAGILLALAGPADANPDVWVKVSLTYHIADDRVTGLSYRWRFDEYFSSRNIEIYDVNDNGHFDDNEIDQLRRESFDPLAQNGYHVHVWHGEAAYSGLDAGKFTASTDNTALVYEFHLALQPAAELSAGPVSASLLDRENVIDCRFVKQNFLLVDGNMPAGCKFQLRRGKGSRAGHPQVVTLECGE